ncbi:hypothetical protein M1K46_03345 [Fictibacillus sp. WQ 8-8]|uniref:hypothetical protein n=1 Tax=Fictibacillus sp. WQ 8-8 TaxID=2938788 RepID=UPI00210C72FC|nr:hypothetical protein [Fictibacillus sp. WQ 8-8]MCQ6264701.1 hypothetical protein [Fictibacillus sp. WQ 8-8]
MNRRRPWLLSKKWGNTAAAALVPYAILKTLWANGVVLLASGKGIAELHASMNAEADPVSKFLYACGIDITALLALIASLLALALVRDWGRKVSRWLLLIPSCLGGLFFIGIGLVTFYWLIVGAVDFSDNPEFSPWVLLPVYGGFLTWGVTISMAALSYGIRTSRSARIAASKANNLKEVD